MKLSIAAVAASARLN